tara:strand:- start:793 stop:1593 length:801 start_codon:yes stop_codon:yes gene_type:complete
MYPILFEIGPFVISSFGFMMVAAFLTCNYLLARDIVKAGYEKQIAEELTFRAAIGGIIGAKLYYLIENIPTGQTYNNLNGLLDIIAGAFTLNFSKVGFGIQNFGAGLVFLGGLIGGTIAVSIYIKKVNLKWLVIADFIGPYLALGHGIGRIGCFLVGDDYGTPSNLPWACSFPNGLPPTTIPVHPTQLYEMFLYFILFLFLYIKKRNKAFIGEIFFNYLFWAGLIRFMIEFIRTNIKYFGFSGAQYISIIMIFISIYYFKKLRINN